MSDVVTSCQTGDPSALAADGSLTAGAMLRGAREAAGLHVAALAVSMKIPVKKLEALEADKLDLLLDAVFVRALASSMCRALKIDPAPVLEKLPPSSLPKLHSAERSINAPFHVPGQNANLSVPAFLAKPGVLAVLALLLGVLILAVFPDISMRDHFSESERITTAAPVASKPEIVTAPPVELSVPVSSVVAATTQESAVLVPGVVKAQPVIAAVIGKPVINAVTSDAGGGLAKVVLFRAKGPTWLEVTDANGGVQIRRTLSAGESVWASGVLPLSIVIGRADAVEVDVRGKAFSLTNIAKDNVARFEVK